MEEGETGLEMPSTPRMVGVDHTHPLLHPMSPPTFHPIQPPLHPPLLPSSPSGVRGREEEEEEERGEGKGRMGGRPTTEMDVGREEGGV